LSRKTVRRRAVRTGLLVGNMAFLAAMLFFILHMPNKTGVASASVLSQAETPKAVVNPLDQLSSTDIAVTVASLVSVPEKTAIINQADSQAAELTQTVTTGNVVAKPQVVATALKSRADIKTYVTKTGDTLASIATEFGVTSDSIRYSNNLSSTDVPAGQTFVIPPVNGFVYTVKAGDTADTLATKYKASKDKIVQFNDAELTGLQPGAQIVIPDATQQIILTTAQVSTRGTGTGTGASTGAVGFAFGGDAALYNGNGYAYGYCTWYVANRLPVPSNWGNANTWDNLAPASGWNKSRVPVVGAVAQTDRGYAGHVAVVEAVSEDGSQIKYSDMNGIAGWGRVGYSDWVSSGSFDWYLYQ
jgi:surface antigen